MSLWFEIVNDMMRDLIIPPQYKVTVSDQDQVDEIAISGLKAFIDIDSQSGHAAVSIDLYSDYIYVVIVPGPILQDATRFSYEYTDPNFMIEIVKHVNQRLAL